MAEVGNAQKETYGVQDVGLAAAIQSRDGVEQRVEAVDLRPLGVGFESLKDNRLDVHLQASRRFRRHRFAVFEDQIGYLKKVDALACRPVFTTDNRESRSSLFSLEFWRQPRSR